MKRYSLLLFTLFTLTVSNLLFAQKNYPTMGKVIYEDPEFEKLLPKTSQVQVLASGFTWTEGPVWNRSEGHLLFSDVPENKVYKWDEKSGISVFLTPSGYTGLGEYSDERGSNGLLIDNLGRLISCEHGDRRISAMPLTTGGKITLSEGLGGKRFNSPNDIIQHAKNNNYYFTDPPYGLPDKHNDKSRELKVFGVYKIDNEGNTTLQVSDLTRPNGLAFSPDGKTLYVAQSDAERAIWMSYPVDEKGNIGKGYVFYDATPMVKAGKAGLPDGLKVDSAGNIWSSGPGGMLVFSPKGKLLGRIEMGEFTSNCAWGDDGSVLYMTVDGYICRIKTSVIGAGW
jgi:gluconolactonase